MRVTLNQVKRLLRHRGGQPPEIRFPGEESFFGGTVPEGTIEVRITKVYRLSPSPKAWEYLKNFPKGKHQPDPGALSFPDPQSPLGY